jgi:hypothetical protein
MLLLLSFLLSLLLLLLSLLLQSLSKAEPLDGPAMARYRQLAW